jgi:hyperosmotically inducible protein
MHFRRMVTGELFACSLLWEGTSTLMAHFQQDDADKAKGPTTAQTKAKDDRPKLPSAADLRQSAEDRDMMLKIRKAVKDDKSLSTDAHNIRVIVKKGKATLKGSVRSAEEKKAADDRAKEVAGAKNVTNRLTIKSQKSEEAKERLQE